MPMSEIRTSGCSDRIASIALACNACVRAASDAGTPPAAGEGPEAEAFAMLATKLLEALDTAAG